MFKSKWWIVPMVAVLALGFGIGCSDSDSDDDDGPATGSYAGTWTGNVAGRALVMTLSQNGNRLSGTYTLSDPTFSEPVNGTVSSVNPPATATLTALDTRFFNITFSSYNAFSGIFHNGDKDLGTNGRK